MELEELVMEMAAYSRNKSDFAPWLVYDSEDPDTRVLLLTDYQEDCFDYISGGATSVAGGCFSLERREPLDCDWS